MLTTLPTDKKYPNNSSIINKGTGENKIVVWGTHLAELVLVCAPCLDLMNSMFTVSCFRFQITTFNQAYLQSISKCGGLRHYLIWQMPSAVKKILQDQFDVYSKDYVYNELGKFGENSVDNNLSSSCPSSFKYFGFGAWLNHYHNDSSLWRTFPQGMSAASMQALYEAIQQTTECDKWSSNSSCQYSLQSGGPFLDSNETFSECTFYECLTYSQDYYKGDTKSPGAPACLMKHLCQNQTVCFDFGSNMPEVVHLLFAFIFDYLIIYAHHLIVVSNDDGIIVSRSQESLALGYRRNNGPGSQGQSKIPGVLPHVDWSVPLPEQSPRVTLSNCYQAVDAAANFHWQGE